MMIIVISMINLYLYYHVSCVTVYFHVLFRLTVAAHCDMDLRTFPHDKQVCGLNIESCEYVRGNVNLV
jgi:hypothetical protein